MSHFSYHHYFIRCLTNLHVGSGDNNYGVIDKEVQRDPVNGFPIIRASSFKGALREYFKDCVSQVDKSTRVKFFGNEKNESAEPGSLRFMEAKILSLPVRGIDETSYYKSTSKELIDQFKETLMLFQTRPEIKFLEKKTEKNAKTEFGDFSQSIELNIEAPTEFISIDNDIMNTNIKKSLPIIARNSLENGQSENLWYEEFVPRESIFYITIACDNNIKEEFEKHFDPNINNKLVQIGANATIGYGFCKISKFE